MNNCHSSYESGLNGVKSSTEASEMLALAERGFEEARRQVAGLKKGRRDYSS